MAGPKERAIKALREVEAREEKHRRHTVHLTAATAAAGVVLPGASVPGLFAIMLTELNHAANFKRFMGKWGEKLVQNPRAARFLATHAHHKTVREELLAIAREAEIRASVRRRAGFRKNPVNPQRNERARIKRRLNDIRAGRMR